MGCGSCLIGLVGGRIIPGGRGGGPVGYNEDARCYISAIRASNEVIRVCRHGANMSKFDHRPRIEDLALTRRELFNKLGAGMATLGLATMLGSEGQLAFAETAKGVSLNPLAVKQPPFPARAKRVIHLFA